MKKPSIKQLLGKGEAQNEITESLRKKDNENSTY